MYSDFVRRAMMRASVVFPHPGGPPEEHRAQIVALDLRAQRFSGAEQIFLADEFVERLRAHAVGERPACERFVLRLDCSKQSHCAPLNTASSKLLP